MPRKSIAGVVAIVFPEDEGRFGSCFDSEFMNLVVLEFFFVIPVTLPEFLLVHRKKTHVSRPNRFKDDKCCFYFKVTNSIAITILHVGFGN